MEPPFYGLSITTEAQPFITIRSRASGVAFILPARPSGLPCHSWFALVSTPMLLVATATQWFGTARIPHSLTRAGFEVFLLAPKDTLAEKSRLAARNPRLAGIRRE